MLQWLYACFFWVSVLIGTTSFGLYALQQLLCQFYFLDQNLRTRYKAKWALVTGSSSGIGKALADRLAKQRLNVVLVALPDRVLDETFNELSEKYPNQQFLKVGADLGRPGYMEPIIESTRNIDVQIFFLNAGYILTGFFFSRSAQEISSNIECNATSAVMLTHHFVRRLVDNKQHGCFVFTSSASAMLPSPFSVSYASTKAMVSMFAASLAAEVKPLGIDVMAVHPSPVSSRFYDKAHKIDAMEFFKRFAVPPEALPKTIFASVGRCLWRDVGLTCIAFRLLSKIVDFGALFWFVSHVTHTSGDYKRELEKLQKSK